MEVTSVQVDRITVGRALLVLSVVLLVLSGLGVQVVGNQGYWGLAALASSFLL